MIRRVVHLFGNLFRRRRVEGELGDEIDAYLELLVAEKVAKGMSLAAARRAARLELGSADEVKERVRDVRAGAGVERFARNIRFALRSLRRTPGFTTFTVLTFALAIGGTTVIFSLVDALLLRPLPYPAADRIVVVMQAEAANPDNGTILSAPNYFDLERGSRGIERMALYEYLGFNLSGEGEPEQVGGLRASSGLFQVLGVKPMLGRALGAGDDLPGSERVVVLSHGLWQRRFGGDSGIIGKPIRINRLPYLVIGVMPKGFAFPSANQALWTSIELNENDQSRGSQSFFAVGRLKEGVSLAQGRKEMRGLGDQLAKDYPASNAGTTANLIRLRDLWMENTERTLTALMAAVLLVLLIASANIASLLVARGSARRREMAARMALGGTRGQVMALLITESVLLAVGGALAGLGLATMGIKALLSILPPGLRYVPFRDLSGLSVNLPVFLFALGIALVAGMLSGVVPALSVLPSEPSEVLRETDGRGATARRGRVLRNTLVAGEIGLAVMVLVGTGLLVSSITRLRGVDPGLDPSNVMVMDIQLPQTDFYGPPIRPQFCQAMSREVGSVAGVSSVSAISHLPLEGSMAGRGFVLEGEPPKEGEEPGASYGVICPGYFRTMGIPLREGRDFEATDRTDAPLVAIINESLQQKYFPRGGAIGRRIRFSRNDTSVPWVTIVGVAADVHQAGLQNGRSPFLYRPYSQSVWPSLKVVVKGRADPLSLAPAVRRALGRVDTEAPVGAPIAMNSVVERSLGQLQFPLLLFSAFAVMAVTLAAVGIFGVASQSVVQRTRELGIRRALGAPDGQLYRMVVGQSMLPVGWGIGAGVLGALAATQILKGLLFGIKPTDPPTFAIVALVVGMVAIVACVVPARRAARVDPIIALRDG